MFLNSRDNDFSHVPTFVFSIKAVKVSGTSPLNIKCCNDDTYIPSSAGAASSKKFNRMFFLCMRSYRFGLNHMCVCVCDELSILSDLISLGLWSFLCMCVGGQVFKKTFSNCYDYDSPYHSLIFHFVVQRTGSPHSTPTTLSIQPFSTPTLT